MKLKFKQVAMVTVCLIVYACSSSNTIEPEVPFAPTPYHLNTPFYFGNNFEIPEDNPTTEEGVELGRMLFYETRLSGDNTQSCASCHQQAKAFTDGNQFSEGIDGELGTKNAMSLTNLLWTKRFFWNGRSASLEEQALIPIEDPIEMHETLENGVAKLQVDTAYPEKFRLAFGNDSISAENIGKALAQFERTLISSNSRYDQYLRGEYQPTDQELLGISMFQTHPTPEIGIRGGNCGDCHVGAMLSGELTGFQGFHNNGLDSDADLKLGLQSVTGNEFDKGKFKAPSLRNIALTAPYMHDGRFTTLNEVLEHYNKHIQRSATVDPLIIEASNEIVVSGEPIKLHLTNTEKEAILSFLHMLTDSTFIQNENFSNPFK